MPHQMLPVGRWRRALFVAALLACASSAAMAQTPAGDPVVAKVDGVEIHQSDLALAEEEVGAKFAAGRHPRSPAQLSDYASH